MLSSVVGVFVREDGNFGMVGLCVQHRMERCALVERILLADRRPRNVPRQPFSGLWFLRRIVVWLLKCGIGAKETFVRRAVCQRETVSICSPTGADRSGAIAVLNANPGEKVCTDFSSMNARIDRSVFRAEPFEQSDSVEPV